MSSDTTQRPTHYVAPIDDVPLGDIDKVRISEKPSNLWLDAWRDLRGRPMFWISGVMILFILFVALFPLVFTAVDPEFCELSKSSQGPQAGHPMGFTMQGCDVYSRVIHGAS